ncbi:ROK family transcriptional regulator [Actinomyces culturomici]|uniref:ROK family transcriptional regulator n=1 Tax=Actinomyces culturomici TaxID=1926276 RepID=UPI001F402339|nr:ROK family transcriptional regulator [Actinomyces culturomici]
MQSSGVLAGSQSSLREANSARVLEAVRRYGRITQVELSATTGLSQATISNIVKQLSAQGAIELTSTIRSGRRAQLVSLKRTGTLVAGLSIGRRALRLCLSDASGADHARQTLPLPLDHKVDTTLDRAALLVMELMESSGASHDDLAGVGVTLPAPIDPSTGTIAFMGIMRGWEGIDIAKVLSRRFEKDVLVVNDANAAAIAENRFGALRGSTNCAYVRASYQTGAGLILDGRLHTGPTGVAGEIGHVIVAPSGPICSCGARGCLNTVVGAESLLDLLRLSRGPMTLRDLLSLAQAGDPGCRQVVVDAGASIGGVLADLATVTGIDRIAIGGELAESGDVLLDPIRRALADRPLLGGSPIEVVPAALGHDAEPLGAIALARDAFVPSFAASKEDS